MATPPEEDKFQKKRDRKTPPVPPPPPNPLPPPLPRAPPAYADAPMFGWWDIENLAIPNWLKPEDVLDRIRRVFLHLGYQLANDIQMSVVVEDSKSKNVPAKTQAKWAILAKTSGVKYMDCKATKRDGKEYQPGEKDIDIEIVH